MSNALKAFGEGHSSILHFVFTMIGGAIYTLASLPIISDSEYLKGPLLIAFLLLLTLKIVSNHSNALLLLAEILPGLGKRMILMFGLISGGSNGLGRVVSPFLPVAEEGKVNSKAKKE